jgi:MFS family permease
MKPIYPLVSFLVLNQMVFTGGRFLVALYAVHLQASTLMLGVLVALFSFTATLTSVPAGRLIDRIGTRTPMLVCLVLLTLGMGLPLVTTGLVPLYITAPLTGGAFFALYTCTSTLSNWYSTREDRAANFSWLTVGASAGQALGPLGAGLLIDHHSHMAAFVMIASLPALSLGLFALAGLRHTSAQSGAVQQHQRGALELLRNPGLRPVLILSTLFIMAADVFVVMVPIYGTQLKLTASEMGMIASAFSLASFIVRALSAQFARWFPAWRLMLVSLAVAGMFTMLIGTVSWLPLLMLFAFCAGFGQGLGAPMSTSVLYEEAPPDRVSEAMGLRLSLGMTTQSVLPVVIGSVGSFVTAEPVFIAMGLALLAGAWMERRQWHRVRPATEEK